MNIKYVTLIITVILISAIFLLPGCLENNDDKKKDGDKEYFSETYINIPFILRIKPEMANNSSYIIIPAPI